MAFLWEVGYRVYGSVFIIQHGCGPNYENLHSVCFIRNAYKERFSPLVKFLEKIRNRLVVFQKVKEQKLVMFLEEISPPAQIGLS